MRGLAGVVIGLVLFAPRADAHTFEHPKTIRLGVNGSTLALSLVYDVNPGREASLLRGVFDRDDDGVLSESESEGAKKYLEQTARLFFSCTVNGKPAAFQNRGSELLRLGTNTKNSKSFGIRMLMSVRVDSTQPLVIVVKDRDKDRSKHVPLTADVAAPWRVRFASQGEWQPGLRQLQRVRLDGQHPLHLAVRHQGLPIGR